MKKFIIGIILIIFLAIGFQYFLPLHPQEPKRFDSTILAPTEHFVFRNLLTEKTMIRTDLQDRQDEYLSESLGLWMLYLVEKNDPETFSHSFLVLNEYFINDKSLVNWKIEGTNNFQTNALIDDLRIIEALYKAGMLWGNKEYINKANEMAKSVAKYNRYHNHWTDYYDMYESGNFLTLSYLSPQALKLMKSHGIIHEDWFAETKQFLSSLPTEGPFFPKRYTVDDHSYHFDEEINLIDQVYLAYHLENFQINTETFFYWLKNEFYKHKLLYGRYNRLTEQPSATFESPSIYALTILYSIERGETAFATDVYDRMMRLQVKNPNSPYYGGYMDFSTNNTHAFDNLLPLYAERKLINENIIQ
ncbi:hypothetical protein [Bacillus kexueae]|uniref:hypothetical protein n=1 Tax=Aeribacillus kexueae TaxID=2078952 RepID=UPI001FAEBDE9|nr:hypothetical protein [Bacillus kexueae]